MATTILDPGPIQIPADSTALPPVTVAGQQVQVVTVPAKTKGGTTGTATFTNGRLTNLSHPT